METVKNRASRKVPKGKNATKKKWAVLATFNTQGRCTNWRGWVQVLDEDPLIQWKHWDTNEQGRREIENEVEKYKPDVLLLLLPDAVSFDLKKMKSLKTKSVFVYADYSDRHHILAPISTNQLDYMFLSNRDRMPEYMAQYHLDKIHYLPMACYRYDGDLPENPKYFDKTVFVGQLDGSLNEDSIYYRRTKIWREFRQHHRFTEHINEPCYPARNDVYDALPSIYNSAKYSINMDAYAEGMDGYTSNRIWAILNFNGLCVTLRFKGMEQLGLIDGETCIVFDDEASLMAKISFYNNFPDKRDQIRANGFALARKKHTHTNRFNEIKKVIAK